MHKNLSLLPGVLMTLFLLSLFSCGRTPPSDEIVSAHLGAGAMSYFDTYSFDIRTTEEGVLFSCDEDNGEGRVTFEDLPAPEALLREFRQAAEDTGFTSCVAKGKKSRKTGVLDATTYRFTLKWADGTERTTTVRPEGEAALRKFLSKAARILGVTEEEAGPLTSLSLSASASWIEGSYSFYVREEKGQFLYDAQFTDVEYGGDGDPREERFDFQDRILTPAQTERIREAAREAGLWNRRLSSGIRWEKPREEGEEDEELIPLDATTFSAYAQWGDTAWGDRGWGDPDWGVLMTTLREIARETAP